MIRTFSLESNFQRSAAIAFAKVAPSHYELIFRPKQKPRTVSQNKFLWALLSDISKNIGLNGKRFDASAWHAQFKKDFLPEVENDFTVKGYQKFLYLPDGSREVIGSTSNLTPLGFSNYIEKITDFARQYGFTKGPSHEYHHTDL